MELPLLGLITVVAVLVLASTAVVVGLVVRRSRAPRYDTYQVGEYNSPGEAPHSGPGPQRPLSGPGGVPIGLS